MDRLTTDRVAAMRGFLLGWYPGPAEVAKPAAADVPAPLAELYAVAAGRPAVLGTQNALYPSDRLRTDPDEGLLVFAAENQGNFTWQIDPTEDDPAVWLVRPGESPVAERERLSGFLVQFCLFEAVWAAPLHAYAWSAPVTVAVTGGLSEVPLAPWHWPGDPTRFFVGPDLVLCTSLQGDNEIAILAGARSPEALRRLAQSDVDWDGFED
jgi:hypothetical protein